MIVDPAPVIKLGAIDYPVLGIPFLQNEEALAGKGLYRFFDFPGLRKQMADDK